MLNKVSTLLVLLGMLTSANSSCHTCQSNRAMCHDERRFTMCSEGISSSDMFECPTGYICTGEVEICIQESAENSPEPTCGTSCDVCTSPGKLFACVSETRYAYCFGGDVPNYDAVGICPDGYVCNLNSPQVCTPAADVYASCYSGSPSGPSTLAPSTISTTDSESSPTDETTLPTSTATDSSDGTTLPTTNSPTDSSDGTTLPTGNPTEDTTLPTSNPATQTPSFSPEIPSEAPATDSPTTTPSDISPTTQPPRDAMTFCKDQQLTGFFRAEGDRSCQEYFYCYLLSEQYLGVKYICAKAKYFDEETKKCESKKPDNC